MTALSSLPVTAADVEITANAASVNLDAYTGTTAHIANGVTVGFGNPALSATLQAWFVTNNGAINGGNTVTLNQGGTFVNESGASITGSQTAITFGYKPFGLPPAGGPGELHNYGTITGGAEGVTMWFGGTVNNYLGGTITSTGLNAVSIGQGTSRILFNAGDINASRLTGFSTGVLMQGGPSTFTNTASGTIFGDYNGVYGSATAIFTFQNAGSITSRRGPAVEATGGGTFTNTGTINSTNSYGFLIRNNATADITNSGTIGGALGAISFANGTGSATHILRLQTGSVLNGNVIGGGGTDNLILNGTGTESIAKFSNFETLAMQGAVWTLTGAGSFSTGTSIDSGVLQVNGQLTSPVVTVQNGGTLGGTGTIIGVVNNSGNVAPGNSIGTLNIVGPYNQLAGSTYTVEINPAQSDLLSITGVATIQAMAGVHVLAAPSLYTVGQRYTILTASGGVVGTYSSLTDNSPFLDFALFYDPNNVYLDVLRASASFAQIAQTPNQKAAASGAEQLGAGNPIFDAILNLNATAALRAFDLLSGEIHPTIRSVLIDDSRFVRDGILTRLRQFPSAAGTGGPGLVSSYAEASDAALAYASKKRATAASALPALLTKTGAVPERSWAVWGDAFGNWGKTDGDGNAATVSHRSGGFVSGVDTTFNGTFGSALRLGIAGAYQTHKLSVDERNSSAGVDSYHLAAYAALLNGPFSLRSGIAHAWHSIETTRNVIFPGFADTTKAAYDGRTTQLFGEVGYTFAVGGLALEPYSGLAHVQVRSDSFSETGGAAALTGLAEDTNIGFSTLGMRAAWPMQISWSTAILKGGLGWRHAFSAVTPATELAFAGGSPFAVFGVPITRDALVVDAGLDLAWSQNATIGLSYTGQYGDSASEHSVKGRAIRRF